MLKPSVEFYEDKVEGRLTVLLTSVVAQEQRNYKEGGAVMFVTNGRTKGGIGNKFSSMVGPFSSNLAAIYDCETAGKEGGK